MAVVVCIVSSTLGVASTTAWAKPGHCNKATGVCTPPSKLKWVSPPSIFDNVPAQYQSISHCPSTRPDGSPIQGVREVEIFVTFTGGGGMGDITPVNADGSWTFVQRVRRGCDQGPRGNGASAVCRCHQHRLRHRGFTGRMQSPSTPFPDVTTDLPVPSPQSPGGRSATGIAAFRDRKVRPDSSIAFNSLGCSRSDHRRIRNETSRGDQIVERTRISARRVRRTSVGVLTVLALHVVGLSGANAAPAPLQEAAASVASPLANLAAPVVGLAATPSGKGYWRVGADGGVLTAGDARFYGSAVGMNNGAIVAIAATRSGRGYWLTDRSGDVFAFGDAAFHGSMGGHPLNRPVVGMAATPTGSGYWLVASDGGVFSFDAPFRGSTGGMGLNRPVVGMAATPTGSGTGSSRPTVASSRSTRPFADRRARCGSTSPSSAWPRHPVATATPWSPPTVGCSGSGRNSPFFGSAVERLPGRAGCRSCDVARRRRLLIAFADARTYAFSPVPPRRNATGRARRRRPGRTTPECGSAPRSRRTPAR